MPTKRTLLSIAALAIDGNDFVSGLNEGGGLVWAKSCDRLGTDICRDLRSTGEGGLRSVRDLGCETCSVDLETYGQGTAGSGGLVPVLDGVRGSCDGTEAPVFQVRSSRSRGSPAHRSHGLGHLSLRADRPLRRGRCRRAGSRGRHRRHHGLRRLFLYAQLASGDPAAAGDIALTNGRVSIVGNRCQRAATPIRGCFDRTLLRGSTRCDECRQTLIPEALQPGVSRR